MRRRIALVLALIGLMSSLGLACTVPARPAVSFSWQNLRFPGNPSGALSGQTVTYSFKATNFPAGSTLSLQRLQGGHWITVNNASARNAGTSTVTPPLGRDHFRIVLSNFSGRVLAQAGLTLDVYDNFPFSTLFFIPRKHLDGYRSFDYDVRDVALGYKSSCLSFYINVNNESASPEVLRLEYTPPGSTVPTLENVSIDRAVGQYGIGKFVVPGTDWAITAQGADLYIEGVATCFTSDGRT